MPSVIGTCWLSVRKGIESPDAKAINMKDNPENGTCDYSYY